MTKQVDVIDPSQFCQPMSDGMAVEPNVDEPEHWKDPDTDHHFETKTHGGLGKIGDIMLRVRPWIPEGPPPPPAPPIKLSDEDNRVPNDWSPNPLVLQVDITTLDGTVTGRIDGLSIDEDEFLENLSESQTTDHRYAYWVSLLDGDLLVNGSKGDDRGLEVGAGGTATINSGKGDDLLRVWHDKNVVFNGGKGDDTITFSVSIGSTPAAPAGAVVDLRTGTGTNPFGGTLTLTGVENVAGVYDKANTLTGNDKANQLISGTEADTIKGQGGDDSIIVESTFSTSPRALNVDGGLGNDSVVAYLGTNGPFTGSGLDLRYVNTLDLLNPANNTGTFNGASFANIETYRAAGDWYTTFDFRGSDSGETAIGIGGADNLEGRGGNDTLRGSAGADTIDGGDGRDVADYSDNLFARIVAKINGASTTITVGGVQQDILISIEGAKGGAANDKLTGDAGANEFDGSLGNDTLAGKGGKDHFAFSTTLGPANVDTIKDFKHGADKLDLDDAIFAALGPTVSSGEFLKVSSGHAARQKDDFLIYNKTDGSLWFDKDGSGHAAAVKFAVLSGSPDTLTHQDFAIV